MNVLQLTISSADSRIYPHRRYAGTFGTSILPILPSGVTTATGLLPDCLRSMPKHTSRDGGTSSSGRTVRIRRCSRTRQSSSPKTVA